MIRAYCSKLGDGAQPPRPLDPAGVSQIDRGPLIELFGEARGIIGDDWSQEARTSFVLLHERAVRVPVWCTARLNQKMRSSFLSLPCDYEEHGQGLLLLEG